MSYITYIKTLHNTLTGLKKYKRNAFYFIFKKFNYGKFLSYFCLKSTYLNSLLEAGLTVTYSTQIIAQQITKSELLQQVTLLGMYRMYDKIRNLNVLDRTKKSGRCVFGEYNTFRKMPWNKSCLRW